ncbi:hypothetical protein ACW95P_02625 [Candidatus Mycoplasma pogonae]
MNFKNKKQKLFNFKKLAMSALFVAPILSSGVLIAASDNGTWKAGETLASWINNPSNEINFLTSKQKSELIRHKNKNNISKAEIKQLDIITKKIYDTYNEMNGWIIYPSTKLANGYFNASQPLKEEWDYQKTSIVSLLESGVIDMPQLLNKLASLYEAWNKLNGLTNDLFSLVNEQANLSRNQKSALYKELTSIDKSKHSNNKDNLNKNFLNKVNEQKEKILELNKAVGELKALVREYSNKRTSKRYTTSTQARKNAYNNALDNASKTLKTTNLKEVKNLKNQILYTYIKLDGFAKLQSSVNSLEAKINSADKLSEAAKSEFVNKLAALVEKGQTKDAALTTEVEKFTTELQELNNSFGKLQKAFQDYRSVVGKEKYNKSTNKNEQDEKVFKALESVLLDTKRFGNEEKTLWRPNDRLLKTWYHIRELKFRAGVTVSDVDASIAKINAAKAGLDGNVGPRYSVDVSKLEKEINALSYLSAGAKADFVKELKALSKRNDLDNSELKSEEAKILKNANDLNASFVKLQETYLGYRSLLNTDAYRWASNKKQQDENVFKALEAVLLDTKRHGEEAKTLWKPADKLLKTWYHISELKLRAGVTVSDVNNSIAKIRKAGESLDGEQVLELGIETYSVDYLRKTIHSFSYLSSSAKNSFTMEVRRVYDGPGELNYQDNGALELMQKIYSIALEAKKLNDSFGKLQKAFQDYRDTTRSQVMNSVDGLRAQDENVFKALESVLLDTKRHGNAEKTLWRPNDGLLKTWYHIRELKFRAGVTVDNVEKAIEEIQNAKKTLMN